MLHKRKLLIETFTDEILTAAALKETEFEYQEKSEQGSIFGWFGQSVFCSKEIYALIGNQVNFLHLDNCGLIS